MSLKPPKPKRIYVVAIDPDAKPRKTMSTTVYGLPLVEVMKRIERSFDEE